MDWQCGVGGSIITCHSIERHIMALESDPMMFNAILLPMREISLCVLPTQLPHHPPLCLIRLSR